LGVDRLGSDVVFHSSDSGASWVICSGPVSYLIDLAATPGRLFANDNFDLRRTLPTCDGWSADGFVFSLAAAGSDVYIHDDYFAIRRSSNDGATWTSLPNAPAENGQLFSALGTVFFSGSDHRLYQAVDRGTSWFDTQLSIPADYFVHFLASDGASLVALADHWAATHGTFDWRLYVRVAGSSSWSAPSLAPLGSQPYISGAAVFQGATWLSLRKSGPSSGGVAFQSLGSSGWTSLNTGLADLDVLGLFVAGSRLFAVTRYGVQRLGGDFGVTVSVEVPDANVSESPLDYGKFTIRRTGSTTSALTVAVQWSGSATPGSDYAALETVATIPAGSASLDFIVIPANDSLVESDETVVLTVASGTGYTPGNPSTGTVVIHSEDQGASSISLSGPPSGPILSPLEFRATATYCSPSPTGWTWTIDNQPPPLQYGGIYTSVAAIGLASTGTHTVRASNVGCPGTVGSRQVVGDPPERQTFDLRARDGVSPSRPTIVFIHGLQPDGNDWDDLWSCIGGCSSSVVHPAGDLVQSINANRLQFKWSGAFQPGGLFEQRSSYITARSFAQEAGIALAGMLRERLGPGYTQKIHFVGHSLGTVVGANAASWFLTQTTGVSEAQFTALDRPDRIPFTEGFDGSYFASVLGPAMRPGLTFKLDNYWALGGLGVGDETLGFPSAKVYNHRRPSSCPGCSAGYDSGLDEPNDIGDYYFESEGTNNHSGVQQWYRWTMNPNTVNPGTCNGSSWAKPSLFHGSLNPCQNGFSWSLLGPSPASFPTEVEPDTAAVTTTPVGGSVTNFGAEGPPALDVYLEVGLGLEEAQINIAVPNGATALSFNLTATNVSASDTIVVSLGGQVIWSGSASVFQPGLAARVGPVPIGELTGTLPLRIQSFGGGSTHITLSNIQAVNVIPPCALADTLCITGQRFRVEASWEDNQGNAGDAVPRYVGTNDSGFFWFFNEANLELVVKVLNACSFPGAPRFWVYGAGLTDVGVRLRVTDTWTGASRTYSNPKGTPFQPIQDTNAFSTCSAPPAVVAPGTGKLVTGVDAAAYLAAAGQGPLEEPRDTGDGLGDAGPPLENGVVGNSLRLNNERFAIDVSWRTATGSSGVGRPVALTNDSGYFWFFSSSNIELVIKVLDACGFPGTPRFWVYAGGLTNVETTITVHDTQTGATKTYTNPLGTAFSPIVDVNAFATCSGGGPTGLSFNVSPTSSVFPRSGVGVPLSGTVTNHDAQQATGVVIQAWISQGAATCAAGGSLVVPQGWSGDTSVLGVVPASSSVTISSQHHQAGVFVSCTTWVAGPGTLRLELKQGDSVLSTLTYPITLQ
jgi:hypothetical protein